MGKIYLTGEVNDRMYRKLSRELDESSGPVKIILNSEGGDAINALAISARIRHHLEEVTVTVVGRCESAAVIILAAGDRRIMTAESWVMVHEDSGPLEGNVSQLERDTKHYRRLENQWNELLEFYTGTPKSKWEELHKAETHLSASECLALKLVDEVI